MTTFTMLGWTLVTGLAAGFVFQRSRLCFVSALRDLYLFRAFHMTRAILLLLLMTVAGGAALVSLRGASGSPVLGPTPQGALAGGAIFALGMVLAGSCAAGAFWRLGEGQVSQLYILLGMLAGTWLYAGLPLSPAAQVQATFTGWPAAAGLALALAGLYGWERRQRHLGEELPSERRGWRIRVPWAPEAGALAMALMLVVFLALTGQTWSVSRAFLFNDAVPVIFCLGLVGGGFLGARFGREWRRRSGGTWSQAAIRLVGGLLMGYGARVGWGCTVGAIMSGLVNLSVQSWFWLAGALVGAAAGAAILRRYMNLYV